MDAPLLRRRRVLGLSATLIAAAVGLAACGGSSSSTSSSSSSGAAASSTQLNLVGFSVIKSAYDELGAAFGETDAGKGVTVKASYGASGAQSRAVIAGQKADVVALSLSPDVDNIVKAGLIDGSWNTDAGKGIASRSVVAIAVRK